MPKNVAFRIESFSFSITYLKRFDNVRENYFVKTVDFRVFLVLMAIRYDFYHQVTIFALNFT